jgi:hypothetical protein
MTLTYTAETADWWNTMPRRDREQLPIDIANIIGRLEFEALGPFYQERAKEIFTQLN